MSRSVLNINENAGTTVGKVISNINEMITEFGGTRTLTTNPNATDFVNNANTDIAALFTAAGLTGYNSLLSTDPASTVISKLNTAFERLYDAAEDEPVAVTKPKVLILGNSYSANSCFYLPFILANQGISCKIVFHFAAGASLSDYVSWWNSTQQTVYEFDTDTDTAWNTTQRTPYASVVSDTWDIISLQQASQESIDLATFSPYTATLISNINNAASGSPAIAWNINHARLARAYNMPLQILANIQSTCTANGITTILPYGTAIFNALTTEVCRTAGIASNTTRNFKNGDNVHLAPGLPMYVASLAIAQAISDKFSLGFAINNDTTQVSEDWSDSESENYKGIAPVYTQAHYIAITDELRAIAKQAATAAIATNFAVTQLNGEVLHVTYVCTNCSVSAPSTLNYGETLRATFTPDDGYSIDSITWQKYWYGVRKGSTFTQELTNGVAEFVVWDNIIITATAN